MNPSPAEQAAAPEVFPLEILPLRPELTHEVFPHSWIFAAVVIVLGADIVAYVAAGFGFLADFDPVRADYLTLLFVLAAVCFYMFVRALEREKGLSFQSHWGGLGGGLGGWTVSRPVVYLLSTGVLMAMLAGAVPHESTPRNSAEIGFMYLADKYMPALTAAQLNRIDKIVISMDRSRLHLTGIAPGQKAIDAVWEQIKQITPRYEDIWVDFKLAPQSGSATTPAAGSATK